MPKKENRKADTRTCHGSNVRHTAQSADVNSKKIFGNHRLLAQFLKYMVCIWSNWEVVRRIMAAVSANLLRRLNVPQDEANGYIHEVIGGNMGYLFENMEKMDIQAERRKTAEAQEKLDKAQIEIVKKDNELAKKDAEIASLKARLEAAERK